MMQYILLYFVYAWILDYAQYKMSRDNYGQLWNGYGAIDSVLNKRAYAPMLYRVFIPYLFAGLRRLVGSRGYNISEMYNLYTIYEPLKIILMWLNLVCFHLYLSTFLFPFEAIMGTTLLAVFWVVTFLYDYIDCYVEGIFFSLFALFTLTGQFEWLCVVMILGAFNKETSILAVPFYFLFTFDLIGSLILVGLFGLVYVALKLVQGTNEHYQRVMLGSHSSLYINIYDLRSIFTPILKGTKFRIFYFSEELLGLGFLVLLVLTFIYTKDFVPLWLLVQWLFVIIFTLIALLFARYRELRVFMPLAIVVIPSVIYAL